MKSSFQVKSKNHLPNQINIRSFIMPDGIAISRSSALFINVLLFFDMHDLNKALFLKISFLFLLLALLVPETIFLPFTTVYASFQLQKSDFSIGVFTLTFLLAGFCSFINHLL